MLVNELLKKLVEAPSVSGCEESIREVMKEELKPCVDEIKVDKVGNLIARKGQGHPVIMLAAHMDELGLMVKYIEKEGYIRFETIGGWDERILPSLKMTIHGNKGPVTGVIGTRPVHLMEKEESKEPIKAKKLYIDIGAKSDKEVLKAGISVGDFITHCGSVEKLIGSRITGHGFDDRIGCYELIEIVKNLKKFKGTVYAVGTIQEEIGLIGVRGSAFGINPDVLIALDVIFSGDTPDIKKEEVSVELGKGPVLNIKDAMSFVHPKVKAWISDTAKKNKIPLQYIVSHSGADDASVGAIIREGIPSGAVLTPTRHLHTPIEIVDMNDVNNVIKLMTKAIQDAYRYFK